MTINNLKQKNIWVNYILFPVPDDPNGRVTKPPKKYSGHPAKVNDPKTWGTYDKAVSSIGKEITHRHFLKSDDKNLQEYKDFKCKLAGVGFCFTENIVGIDIDDCIGNPTLEKQADEIIKHFHSYTEKSPSKTGYHILITCDLSKLPENYRDLYDMNPHRHNMECYVAGITNKYFTYTGDTSDEIIEDRTQELIQFLNMHMLIKQSTANTENTEKIEGGESASKDEIIDFIKTTSSCKTFDKLYYNGDINGFKSPSDAEFTLCLITARACQGNALIIDSIIRDSKLIRPKWDEKRGSGTYGSGTINRAITAAKEKGFFKKPGRPKTEKDEDHEKKHITVEELKIFMKNNGISVTYNVIKRIAEVKGLPEYSREHLQNALPLILTEMINNSGLYKRTNKDKVMDSVTIILSENSQQYNPVLELIEGGKWDGVNRLPELYNILHLENDEDGNFSKVLIVKWLWQNLSMARNELEGAYGADGLLVLQGPQGIGKTTFGEKMAIQPELFNMGKRLDFRDKDTLRRCGSNWIPELGEIETTFKSDKEALKAFITDATDEYRLPYARADVHMARRASLFGTCNSTEFLIDDENRRFWTVPVSNINLDALAKFDALQLYLQIDTKAKKDPQGFRLIPEERQKLEKRNSMHEKFTGCLEEVTAILYKEKAAELEFITDLNEKVAEQEQGDCPMSKEEYNAHIAHYRKEHYALLTPAEFRGWHIIILEKYNPSQVGKALAKYGTPQTMKKGKDGKVYRVYELPKPPGNFEYIFKENTGK